MKLNKFYCHAFHREYNKLIYIIIHYYWYNLRYSASESNTWQNGLSGHGLCAPMSVIQCNMKGCQEKQTESMVQVLLLAIHSCLVTNTELCVNNFMDCNRFYIHTYIKYFHKLYMYTERKKRKENPSRNSHHQPHCKLTDNRFQCNRQWKISPRRQHLA